MELGDVIQLPEIPALGLGSLNVTLPASDLRREVKVYKVPEVVSADKYYISVTEAGGVEEVPPSRSQDTLPLVHYDLSPDGESIVKFIHEEVENA